MSSENPAAAARQGSIRVGVAGCGNAAEVLHLPILRGLGAEVVALADPEPRALALLGDRFGVERRHSDARALVEDPGVDVVAVLTPPEVRAEIVLPALEAGKHVLVEKPLALTLAEAETLVEAGRRHPDLVAMAGLPLRFHRLVRAARELIAEGRLGTPAAIGTVNFGPPTELAPGRRLSPWRLDRNRGGGTLVDKGIHQYDLWRYLLGREVEQVSTVSLADGGIDRASVITALVEGGAIASAMLVTTEGAASRTAVAGPRGRLEIDAHRFDGLTFEPADSFSGSPRSRLARARATLRGLPHGIRSLRGGGDFMACYEQEWRHLLACVRGEATLESTLQDGLEATRISLAAIESVRTGAPVPPARDAVAAA